MHTYKTDPEKLYLLEVVTTETFEGWNGQKKNLIDISNIRCKIYTEKKIRTRGDNFSKVTMNIQKLGKSSTEIYRKLVKELT